MPWSADFQARFGGDVGGSGAIRKFVQQNTHTHRVPMQSSRLPANLLAASDLRP